MLQLQLVQGRRQIQRAELNSMTQSVFVITEVYLTKSEGASYHQKLLGLFASKESMECYRSIEDMLLCRVFPEYKKACFNYYRWGGKQLREVASIEEIELIDKALWFSLVIANIVVSLKIPVESRKVFLENCRYLIQKNFPYSTEIAEKHSSSTLFLNDEERKLWNIP